MTRLLLFLLIVVVANPSCRAAQKGINQGIKGYVYFVSGNRMPSPDRKMASPKGLKTTVYVYELTSLSQVTRSGDAPFYSNIHTRFVKEFVSAPDGSFSISLPPGKYSLFTKKDTLYYANRFDEHSNIFPVDVTANTVTEIDITVDYDAVY